MIQKIGIIIAVALVAVMVYSIGRSDMPTAFKGLGDSGCVTSTSSAEIVGHQVSRTVLPAYGSRAWAQITAPGILEGAVATNTITISIDEGAAAVKNKGYVLTTTTPTIVFGLNTDLPYTGAVTAITNVGTTSVLVTECRY